MASIASLIVRIGADKKEIDAALTAVGVKASALGNDLKKIGNAPIGDKARQSLDSLKASMKAITDAQERIAERGRAAAVGIETMGGASRLTDSQLKQMNRTLQEGVSAFRALGKEAPEDLQKVADAVKGKLEQPMSTIQTKAIALGTALGTALGNAAIQLGREFVQAGKRAFEYADSLANLAVTTGIGVEALQRLEALGTTSGVSLQELGNAVGQLQKRLDDPAAIKALREMGLNYQLIRDLKPEDQFLTIAERIAAIEDPVERMNQGVALFGRQWATIAPAVTANMREITQGVNALSAEQIKALDAAGDRWDLWVKERERDVARFLGSMILAIEKGKELQNLRLSPDAAQAAQLEDLLTASGRIGVQGPRPGRLPIGAGPAGLPSFTDKGLEYQLEVSKKLLEQTDKNIAAAEKFKQVQDQLFGRAIIANAELLVKALGADENLTKLTAEATRKLNQELGQAIAIYRQLGTEVPARLQEIYEKTTQLQLTPVSPPLEGLLVFNREAGDVIRTGRDFSKILSSTGIEVNKLGNAVKVQLAPSLDGLTKTFDEGTEGAASFQKAITSIFTGKGFKDLGSFFKSGLESIKTGFFEGIGNLITGGITGLIDKGIALIGAGIQRAFGKDGRKLKQQFSNSFGFDGELRQRLNALGEEGERLWLRFLNVGSRDQEGAQRAIDDITKALERAESQFRDLQSAVGETGEKLSAITVLTPELQAGLDAVFNATNTEEYLAAVGKINAELDKQAQKYAATEAALQKYGLSFAQAGDAFQQAKLSERAQELNKDFHLLIESGVDINATLRAMGPSIRDFVKDAQVAGVEVPDAMQKIIQSAIDAGELFDENGDKITDISQLGLRFGTTMETVAKTVGSAIERLNQILEGLAKFLGITLPAAAAKGADGIEDALSKIDVPDIDVNVDYHTTGLTSQDELERKVPGYAARGGLVKPWGIQHFAGGGVARGTDTVPAMLTPGELVLNAAQQNNLAGNLAGGTEIHMHFSGPVLAEQAYVEKVVTPAVLAGIERYERQRFARLQAQVAR